MRCTRRAASCRSRCQRSAQHLHGTGKATDGGTGFPSYDRSAIAPATANSSIDGSVSTSMTQTQLKEVFDAYPILGLWLELRILQGNVRLADTLWFRGC